MILPVILRYKSLKLSIMSGNVASNFVRYADAFFTGALLLWRTSETSMSLATFVGIGVSLRVRDSVRTSTICNTKKNYKHSTAGLAYFTLHLFKLLSISIMERYMLCLQSSIISPKAKVHESSAIKSPKKKHEKISLAGQAPNFVYLIGKIDYLSSSISIIQCKTHGFLYLTSF